MMRLTPHNDLRRMDIQLAVVILTHGVGDNVMGLLNHLSAETITLTNELIVVHNQSRPNETLTLSPYDKVRIVELTTNRGYVGGMNTGIELALQSKPEYVLILTHDVRITADEVQELYALMCDHNDLGVIGPVLCGLDNIPYSTGFVQGNRIQMKHRVPAGDIPAPIWSCAAIDGSAMMWRATVLEAVGGFDERFFMYCEDVDICARANKCGWNIAAATDVRVFSAPGKGHRRSAHAYLRTRNGLAYARTFGPAGLLAGLAECAVDLWQATPKPGGRRFRDKEARQVAAKYWRGTLFGVLDYFRGRWGPPPLSLLRDSDMQGTST